MSLLPRGCIKTRLLLTGATSDFSVRLRQPVDGVFLISVVSMNTQAILQIDGFNTGRCTSYDPSGNSYQFDYVANNLSGSLANTTTSKPSVAPTDTSQNVATLHLSLVDAYGNPFLLIMVSAVTVELDCFSYTR